MTNRASLTAEYMALFRALESSRPAGSRFFVDPDASLFLCGWRKWLARLATVPAGRQIAERLLDRASPGARATGVARTKWIDDEATGALETARQLVLLGAGFDMRAFRLRSATHARTFELDHPETSHSKQAIARRDLPERIRYIGIDFNSQSIAEVLLHAGFDNSRPASLIWEGVTNYLTPEAVDRSLVTSNSPDGALRSFSSRGTVMRHVAGRFLLRRPRKDQIDSSSSSSI